MGVNLNRRLPGRIGLPILLVLLHFLVVLVVRGQFVPARRARVVLLQPRHQALGVENMTTWHLIHDAFFRVAFRFLIIIIVVAYYLHVFVFALLATGLLVSKGISDRREANTALHLDFLEVDHFVLFEFIDSTF